MEKNKSSALTAKEALEKATKVIQRESEVELERIFWLIRHQSSRYGLTYEKINSEKVPEDVKPVVLKTLKSKGFKAKYHTWKSNGVTILVLSWGKLSLRQVLKIRVIL